MLAALVVLEHQSPRRAVAGEVDAGRPLAGDRLDQVVERAQLGRDQGAKLGERLGDPVTLRLVAQFAPFRRRDVHHQLERSGRLPGQLLRADLARGAAHQVDPPVADQERAVQPEQLPGERQQRVVAAPEDDERPRSIRDHRLTEPGHARLVEEQAEQRIAQRIRMAEQLRAVGVALDRLPGQRVEPEQGHAETVVIPPGRAHLAARPGRTLDGDQVAGPLHFEDEFLADGQAAHIPLLQVLESADQLGQLEGHPRRVAVVGVKDLDRAKDRRQIDLFDAVRGGPG